MNTRSIRAAVTKAEKFIRRAKAMLAVDHSENGYHPSKNAGALRRQSMELTRALTEMRRPG